RLTDLSVACADSRTAIRSWKGVPYSSSVLGSGLAARRRSNISIRRARFNGMVLVESWLTASGGAETKSRACRAAGAGPGERGGDGGLFGIGGGRVRSGARRGAVGRGAGGYACVGPGSEWALRGGSAGEALQAGFAPPEALAGDGRVGGLPVADRAGGFHD